MSFEANAVLLAGGLFLAMLAMQEIGRRLGVRARRLGGEAAVAGTGVVEGAVFALLGLLIAFTFSGAASRFDDRRKLIVEEANAIGTAYLRLDLLPSAAQADLRESFRRYLDTRLAVYRALPDLAKAEAELARAAGMQQEIWTKSLTAAAGVQPATMLLLPALNDMFDITTTRTWATKMHPPTVIFALLCGLAVLSALLAGYAASGTQARNWVHTTVFALTLAGAVYVILDIEFPRVGLIRVDAFDQVLVDLRQSMR
jgi:hypothetical protein